MNATQEATFSQIRKMIAILTDRGLITDGRLVEGWGNRVDMPAGCNMYHDDPREVFRRVTSDDAAQWIAVHC